MSHQTSSSGSSQSWLPQMGETGLLLLALIMGLTAEMTPVAAGASGPVAGAVAPAATNHWAFRPMVEPAVPAVRDSSWARTPIDQFILAGLERAGLRPSPTAERRVLLRRAAFGLTGLPPTPEAMEDFVRDPDPHAFARRVDGYLSSPHYGERWGRHWLDLARYADSNGMDENLAYGQAWRYRNYVIGAFNQDKPYDVFVREQLAGDLLAVENPADDLSHRWIATGFLSLGPKMLAEDDPVKMEMDIVDEQLDTASRVFMGLTVGCARCHDHKYDPISTQDYYGLAGILKSAKTMDHFKVVARWQEQPVGSAAAMAAWRRHRDQLDAHKQSIEARTVEAHAALVEEEQADVESYLLAAAERRRLRQAAWTEAERRLGRRWQEDLSAWVVEAESYDLGHEIQIARAGAGQGIGIVQGSPGSVNRAEYEIVVPRSGWYQWDVRYAAAESRPLKLWVNGSLVRTQVLHRVTGGWDPNAQRWYREGAIYLLPGANRLRLERDGPWPHVDQWVLSGGWTEPEQTGTGRLRNPAGLPAAERAQGRPRVAEYLAQWERFLAKESVSSNSSFYGWLDRVVALPWMQGSPTVTNGLASRQGVVGSAAGDSVRAWIATLSEKLRHVGSASSTGAGGLDAEARRLRDLASDPQGPWARSAGEEEWYRPSFRQTLAGLRAELGAMEREGPRLPEAMVVTEGKPTDLAIHKRGSHLALGAVVPRGFPSVFAAVPAPPVPGGASGRLEWAQWLTAPTHPLTARVLVNRVWHWHFGEGLVRSPDNFGVLGERPTHPELLDWLALRLIESGWSIKSLHRWILASAVYQQASLQATRAAAVSGDPENRWWSYFPRRRLEVEAIRDALLFVSGGLDAQPSGSLLGIENRTYVTSTANNLDLAIYEKPVRSVYLPVVRSALYDLFQAFDFADPSSMNGRRDQTVVAPQALFMMNSRLVAEASDRLSTQVLAASGQDDGARLQALYQRAYGRFAGETERQAGLRHLARYEAALREQGMTPAAARHGAWKSMARAILAGSEFIYLD